MYSFGEAQLELDKPRTDLNIPGLSKVYAYLRERGIHEDLIDTLGLLIVPARELISRARGGQVMDDPRLAVVFPHQNINGKTTDWWSARLVDTGVALAPSKGFAALVEQRKWGKMFCPPNEPPHAYLAPLLDWSKLQKGDRVYIHESCIKAINGSRLGRYSIGLNGVYGFSSSKHQLALVEELKALPWKALGLQPIIVFDSNAVDNWDVQHAISMLASRLYEITGKRARHILLPKREDGEHWGFDDYCVSLGDDRAREFLDSEGVEVAVSGVEVLKLQLNAEVCVVKSLGRIVEQETGTLMSKSTFCEVNYAHYMAEIEDKKVNVPKLWLTDERRTQVENLEYLPGAPRVQQGAWLNLWRGWGLEPSNGPVEPWLQLVQAQVPAQGLRAWLLGWLAAPLQVPGTKANTFVHLYGPSGVGKNALLLPLLEIYGKNGVVIGRDQIASTFNSVYANRQFVNLDEIHSGTEIGALAISNRVKKLVTDETMVVNTKGQPEYTIRNCLNLVTTSNYSDSIKLDDDDRRAAVIKFEVQMGEEWWNKYFEWLRGGGAAYLYAWLLAMKIEGYDPKGQAPHTEWKDTVIDATRDAMQKWVRDLWTEPDSVLPVTLSGAKILTPEQLGAAYHPGEPMKNTPGLRNALGMKMSDVGFKRTELIWLDGKPRRVWIISDRDSEWDKDRVRVEWRRHAGKF